MNCKVCNHKVNKLIEAPIFSRRKMISYYKCESCYFIQTEEPVWLEESYSEVIAKTDIGLIYRNIKNSDITEKVISNLLPSVNKCLDFGGGYGVFVRIMRDKGFDFYWYDDYCSNLFSEYFEGSLDETYDLITAFEVFEHLPNPMSTITKLASMSNNIIFSTVTTDGIIDFQNWWYRGETSGQHISFYNTKTLNNIANKLDLNYYPIEGGSIHLFSKDKINNKNTNAINKINFMMKIINKNNKNKVQKRESLLQSDYELMLKKIL
jgi:2-polyprenyl-3-methyl-5-hydroxy-6-metoxy-1,4-benzoquinol methylase